MYVELNVVKCATIFPAYVQDWQASFLHVMTVFWTATQITRLHIQIFFEHC